MTKDNGIVAQVRTILDLSAKPKLLADWSFLQFSA
jgi:hypothetical protein